MAVLDMFNLSESVRARYLIGKMMLSNDDVRSNVGVQTNYGTTADAATSSVIEAVASWTNIATRLGIVASLYWAFFTLKKKFCPDKKSTFVGTSGSKAIVKNSSRGTNSGIGGTEEEVCPICLDPPRSGVRAGCGHRLCARCLRSYCESHLQKRHRPPPCPLCRTPLVSVTLTYDQINLLSSDCDGYNDTVDPAIAQWVRRYNENRGVVGQESCFLVKNTMTIVKLLLAFVFFGVAARFQNLYGVDLVAYSTYFVSVLGMVLLVCLWFKSKEQVEYEESFNSTANSSSSN